MNELKELAIYAARNRIYGRSYKRNSLLKPLDFILDELTRYPNEEEFARASSKGMIFDHVKRIRKGVHEEAVYDYVDRFFNEVLGKALQGKVNKLLQRERSLRSAYLVYMRQELAIIWQGRKKVSSPEEAFQAMDQAAEEDVELEEADVV